MGVGIKTIIGWCFLLAPIAVCIFVELLAWWWNRPAAKRAKTNDRFVRSE